MSTAIRKFIRNSFLIANKLRVAICWIACFSYTCIQPIVAQVCANPSGEIVFNQTFGTVSNPVSLAGLTTYEYEPINCPGDGQYTLATTLDGNCFNATWYAVSTDHTSSDGQGNMLIVNGGSLAGTFYQQPVSGLCKGTSYEVSVWVLNLLKTGTCSNPLIPNLSIHIETKDGFLIQSTVIGLIQQADTPTWRRCSTVFTVPTTDGEVVIKLINNQGDLGCGNDMLIDDLQVKQCSECVGPPELVYVPDVFTPNNDGVNDNLAVFLSPSASSSFALNIYNRWGSLIFTSTDPTYKWDGNYAGTACATGAYTWVIAYRSSTLPRIETVKTGHVLLMR
ncbi:T9SS type B sorting domain-containing protein [Spirosoma sp. HMF3257]|uniref:Gliding motility-associated C-terminal domain-containing protein n=1 Tax=Spirosoma telluris TaxID=2183553 RepID=A0A327NIA3_9BACT|nr:T9SS type B sorting domain-containing protein [Spirosoma telluris]RAI73746.1 gliding motility-associated C-terminal domain-containing protein [Spirosoma telluris]